MPNPYREIRTAAGRVMAKPAYRGWFAVLAMVVFAVFVLLPAFLIPYNTLSLQLRILRPTDYAVFAVLSAATSLQILIQFHLFRATRNTRERAGAVGHGGIGAYSAIMGGLLATAACSSCIAGLLGFLGAGTVLFVAKHNFYVAAGALALMLISLYYSACRVNGRCESCEVPRRA